MNAATLKKVRWFWPWQDEKEQTWLETMSQGGRHLESVQLPCVYTFRLGEPRSYAYRLDYMTADKENWPEYLQIFQDAGWEYVGAMSSWRYWRKQVSAGETSEIFTDTESKLRRFKRLLAYVGFMLALLVFIGLDLLAARPWARFAPWSLVFTIYVVGAALYAVLIPVYIVVVVQLLRRIRDLKSKTL